MLGKQPPYAGAVGRIVLKRPLDLLLGAYGLVVNHRPPYGYGKAKRGSQDWWSQKGKLEKGIHENVKINRY